jgi:hypothetical protein
LTQPGDRFWTELDYGHTTGARSVTRELPFAQEGVIVPAVIRLARRSEIRRWLGREDDPVGAEQVASAPIAAPKVTEHEPWIKWAWDDPRPMGRGARVQEDVRDALTAFLRLGDGPEKYFTDRVLAFIRHWGPLCLCAEHEMPVTHKLECGSVEAMAEPDWYRYERVGAWAVWVSRARSIMKLAHALHNGLLGRAEEWGAASSHRRPPLRFATYELAEQQAAVMLLVDDWIRTSEARIQPVWEPDRPAGLRFRSGHMVFGALAVQLLFAVARAPSGQLFFCDGCGEPLFRERLPRVGYRTFCDKPQCKRAQARLAKRDQRAGKARWRRAV